MLDDPLFALRHAVAQSRLGAELLQTLNALVPYQPFGRYAELLYRHAGSASGPLAEFRAHIDMLALEKTVLHAERRAVRDHLAQIRSRIVDLAGSRLPVVFNDFLHARDVRLCEPYVLVSEMQQALRSPTSCDPLCIEAEDVQAAKAACTLAAQLAEGKHALTRGLLPEGAKHPETLQRLLALKQSNNLPVPGRVGISSMNFFAQAAYATQNLMLGIDELFGDFIKSTSLAIQEISQNEKLTQVRLDRLFAASFDLLKQLHSQAAGLQRITQGKALSEGLVVLGVHGAGLSFGLTLAERQTMARQNFQYANLQGKDGSTIASSSLKQANRLNFARQNLGPVTVRGRSLPTTRWSPSSPGCAGLRRTLASWKRSAPYRYCPCGGGVCGVQPVCEYCGGGFVAGKRTLKVRCRCDFGCHRSGFGQQYPRRCVSSKDSARRIPLVHALGKERLLYPVGILGKDPQGTHRQ